MDEKQFALLLGQIGDLTPAQFKELVKSYAGHSGQDAKRVWDASVYAVSEQHLADLGVNRACPGCGSVAVVHNGLTDAGIQRFHCQDCGKSFTRFTGTLLEKSRFPWGVWVQVLKMVLNDDSLQDIPTVLEQDFACEGINIKTVFSMRMKLIHAMAGIEPPKLTGVIQMDESFVRESQKGRNLELVSPESVKLMRQNRATPCAATTSVIFPIHPLGERSKTSNPLQHKAFSQFSI